MSHLVSYPARNAHYCKIKICIMKSGSQKYEYIDLARGIAILCVILVHMRDMRGQIRLYTGFGQLGVQLFFVASALTLCLSVQARGLSIRDVGAFALRRWFRIAPLYYLAMAIYSLSNRGPAHSKSDILGNLFFLQGIFPFVSNGVVPGSWSIGTEMAFYALLPALYSALCNRERAIFAYAAYMGGLGYVAFLTRLGYLGSFNIPNNDFLYFNILVQFPVFLAGIIAYHLIRSEIPKSPWNALRVAAMSMTVAIGGLFVWNSSWAAKFGIVPGLFGLAFGCLLYWLSGVGKQFMHFIPLNIVREIGKKSYGIYLFHFLFVWHYWCQIKGYLSVDQLPAAWADWMEFLFVTGAAYVVALVANVVIENPAIELGKRIIQRFIYSHMRSETPEAAAKVGDESIDRVQAEFSMKLFIGC